jgi:hypothetical protein
MSERVLFFSPHAGIWLHAFPEALIADAVRGGGGDVVMVTCNGALSSFCVTMAAYGLQPDSASGDKRKVCARCHRNRNHVRRGFGFRSYDLDSVLDAADEQRVTELVAAARRDDVLGFTVDGVAIGRAALYEYLIHRKRSRLVFTDGEWDSFRRHLANVVRSFFAARRILDRERPTRVVAYNTLYSVNAVWRAVADARGILVYFIHVGPSLARRLGTVMLGRDSTLRTIYRTIDAWPAHADVPCTAAELSAVTDHFCEVMRGTSVFAYSAPKARGTEDWRSSYGIHRDHKLLVATMSSYDEYVAAHTVGEMPDEAGLAFASQIEWIRALVAWIRDKPDRFLLVRVHPREFPNKREGVTSEHARALERELVDLPANVRVNWPADGISMYDIAEHGDVFLNAWSSVGKEMALLGRPVVVYAPRLLNYAPAINYVGETEEAYFAAIEAALRDGWSFETARRAYRWCAVEYVRAIADISDGFDYSDAGRTPLARAKNLAMTLPHVQQIYDLWRRPRVLHEQARLAAVILDGKDSLLDVPAPRTAVTERDETAALRRELGRLATALYGSAPRAPEPGTLQHHLASLRS